MLQGTPFPEFGDFEDSLDRRGLGAMEMLACELKTQVVCLAAGVRGGGNGEGRVRACITCCLGQGTYMSRGLATMRASLPMCSHAYDGAIRDLR